MSGGAVRIWCLRHGESQNVTAGLAGIVPTAPLTRHGCDQATDAALALSTEPIAAVYASTALRARQTAHRIASTHSIEVQVLPELAEAGIGRSEGSADPEVRARTADVLRAWIVEDDLTQRVTDGESGHEILARMTAAFQYIAGRHPGHTIAVVGHVASLTIALDQLCGLDGVAWGTPLPHAKPFLIEWDSDRWHCPAWPTANT